MMNLIRIAKAKGDFENYCFENLSKFVLNILSLAHSNATCEHKVNNIKTKYRNKLDNDSLTKIILAKESVSRTK